MTQRMAQGAIRKGGLMGWRSIATVLIGLWGMCAHAQTLPWPVDENSRSAAPSVSSGTQQTLCTLEITRLNENVEALRTAARTANERRAKREEMCRYLNELAAAATRLTRYAVDNKSACNLSAGIIQQIRDGGQQAIGVCQQICVFEPAAGRLDDVPAQFATPTRLAQSECGDR
jgi:hypothetical protein